MSEPKVGKFLYSGSSEDKEVEIKVNFGKNGYGITSELKTIGEEIEKLSEGGLIYIKDCFIDTLDDVYSFTFLKVPFTKE